MQDELQIEFSDGEEILAIGEKNHVMYICNTLLLILLIILFLHQAFTINSFISSFYFGFLSIIFFITTIFSVYSYNSNQIYLTNKKLVITQKDSINVVQHEEVESFLWYMVYLKSKRIFFFPYTNLDDLISQFEEVYPSYESKKITFKDLIAIALMLLLVFSIKFLPIVYGKISKYKSSNSSTEQIITDSSSYMNYLQKVLKLNWKPPKLQNDAKVVVEFQVLKDGSIINEKVIKTSGSRELDNSALFALKKSNPLRSLPYDLRKEKEVIINFTFDYHVKK